MPDINPQDIVNEIQVSIDIFSESVDPIQKDLYNKLSATLKELALDSEGNIKRTAANLKIIKKVEKQLSSVISDRKYQANIAKLQQYLSDSTELQEKYFNQADDADKPPVISEMEAQAFDASVASLTGAGLKENLVNAATKIVSQGITEGTSFADMNDEMRRFMLGDKEVEGKLLGYSKQIVSNTLHSVSRNYNSLMTENLGLEWFQYVGALVKDSRPWCKALVRKRWIHQSELGAICRGIIDGEKVSLAGLMPDTDKENVCSRCGGYGCTHHMVPVTAEAVPLEVRRKFEKVTA